MELQQHEWAVVSNARRSGGPPQIGLKDPAQLGAFKGRGGVVDGSRLDGIEPFGGIGVACYGNDGQAFRGAFLRTGRR